MATNQTITFKDPVCITAWLDTALKKEKYEKCPVIPDMAPGHDVAEGWGYVVAGYFLVEMSFKALLYLRNLRKGNALTKHSLTPLFELFDENDKVILREYFADYQAIIGTCQ